MVAVGGVVIPLVAADPAQAASQAVYNIPTGVTSIIGVELTSSTNGVLISGGGTAIIANTSNYMSGVVTVNDGSTLAIKYDSVLGSTSAIVLGGDTVGNSGILDFNEIYTSGSTTSHFEISSSLTDDHGILVNSGGGVIEVGGTVYSATSVASLTVTSQYIVDLEGVISGTGPLTISGNNNGSGSSGEVELDANNVWTGGLVVEGDAIVGVDRNQSLGTSANLVTLNGGTIQFLDGGRSYGNEIVLASGTSDTLDAQTYSNTLTGVITGTGALIINGNSSGGGVIILTNDETYTGDTTVEGGTLLLSGGNISGTGTVTVTSHVQTISTFVGTGTSETVSVTSYTTYGSLGGIGTIGGDVSVTNGGSIIGGINGSGTLVIDGNLVVSSGSYLTVELASGSVGKIQVDGDATLSGTLKLEYSGYTNAGTYDFLTVDGTTTGSFTSTTDDLYSAGLESSVTSNSVTLTQLKALPTGDLPTIVAATANVAVDDAQFANRYILDRLQSVRLTALAQREQVALSDHHQVRNLSPYGFWVAPLGGFGSTSSSDGAPGYSTKKYGLALGYDGVGGPGWVYGASLSYQHDKITQNDGGTGTINTPRFQAYGGWWRGRYAVDFTVGDGDGSITTNRSYSATLVNYLDGDKVSTPFSGNADGKRSANEITAAVQASANYLLGYKWAVSPAAGVKFARISITGMTESGSDYFDYQFARQDINSVRPFVDAAASRRFYFNNGAALLPEVRVGIEDEVGNRSRNLTAMTYGDDYNWTIQGVKPASLALDVDLGLAYETSKSQSFGVKFLGTESTSSKDQTFTFQYGLRF